MTEVHEDEARLLQEHQRPRGNLKSCHLGSGTTPLSLPQKWTESTKAGKTRQYQRSPTPLHAPALETRTSQVRAPWFRDAVNSAGVRHMRVTVVMLLMSDLG